MRHSPSAIRLSNEASERGLLAACRDGAVCAIEPLIDMHVGAGLSLALRLAPPELAHDELLDLVHDAFITSFEEALENDASSFVGIFHGLIRLFFERSPRRCDEPGDDWTISPQAMRQRRTELALELRVVVGIHAEAPHASTRAQRLLEELRVLRRRLRLAADVLRARQRDVTRTHS